MIKYISGKYLLISMKKILIKRCNENIRNSFQFEENLNEFIIALP